MQFSRYAEPQAPLPAWGSVEATERPTEAGRDPSRLNSIALETDPVRHEPHGLNEERAGGLRGRQVVDIRSRAGSPGS